jgi:hypothetical protein
LHYERLRSSGRSRPRRGRDGPNLWWPNDRAWFVATEIDLVSTYVGGSADLVRAIVASPEIEAFEVAADGPYAS